MRCRYVSFPTTDGNGARPPPCGACRELMTPLMPDHYRDIEVMPDGDRVVTLGDLTPEWRI